MQNDDVTHKKVVVGTIPCPINEYGGSGDLASEASGSVIVGGAEEDEASEGVSGDHDDPSIDGQEGMKDGEAVVVGTIPCPTGEKVNEKQGEKQKEKVDEKQGDP